MATFVALFFSALAASAGLALAATGFLVLHQATGVINFAHGDLITLSGYVAFWGTATLGLTSSVSYLLAIVVLGLVGIALERVAYAPLRDRPHVTVLIATLAAALVLRALISQWQGSTPVRLPSPVHGSFDVLGATISFHRLLVIVCAAAVMAGVGVMLNFSNFGRQLRALAADPLAARLCGVDVRKMSIGAWALSAGLAACAGVLLAPLTVLDLGFGFSVMLTAFAAAVLGGFGTLRGACLGALLVGFLQQFVGGYVFKDYASIMPFVAMVAILAVRPTGLVRTTAGRL